MEGVPKAMDAGTASELPERIYRMKGRFTMICGVPFEIVERPRNARDDDNMGKCDIVESKIFINADMSNETKGATLVHEWIHGVLSHSGIEHDEVTVSVLANELYREGYRIKTYPKR